MKALSPQRAVALGAAAVVLWLVQGCVLAPPGLQDERRRLDAQRQFELAAQTLELEPLPSPAAWTDVLRRALVANGDLQRAYFEWKAALARVDQAAAWPNTNLMVGYTYMFSGGNMKGWDRSTFAFQPDPMTNLQLPVKPAQAGKAALQDAIAAGRRFAAAKFALQRRVLNAYYDLALIEELIRIQARNVELLEGLAQSARARVQAGAGQQDLLKAQIELRMAQNELQNAQAQAASAKAMLNGLLARDAQAPLTIEPQLPTPRRVPDDARLLAMGVADNPELAALAAEAQGRSDALELARLRYLPDINPMFAFTGEVSQMAGAAVMLPTNLPAIRGAVGEAQAMLRASQAASRQAHRDKAAEFVAALYFMRNAQRQAELYEGPITALAEQSLTSSRTTYATGTAGYAELYDSQRTLLNVRLTAAQMRIERERRLAELEALAGVDVETLMLPTTVTAPATGPGGIESEGK
jgi:outer membrane protein TolC